MNNIPIKKPIPCIWIDQNINDSPEISKLIASVSSQFSFTSFDTIESGQKAIDELEGDAKVCLIISGTLGKELIPRIHDNQHILDIFIFCLIPEDHKTLAENYKKVKRIVDETNRLKVELQNCYYPDNDRVSSLSDDESGLFTLVDLVRAGELEFNAKDMELVAQELFTAHKDSINGNLDALIDEILRPMMYFLKRELRLTKFTEALRDKFQEGGIESPISQRFLVDMLLKRSNRFIHRRLISLLSKRNPVPLLQPSRNSQFPGYYVSFDIIHVWKFECPSLFSFGIEEIQGKSRLLNELFLCYFEESTKNNYFDGTIDIDFDYHFNGERKLTVADGHGDFSIDRVKQLSTMFSGFLIHIESETFLKDPTKLYNYLEKLAHKKYIHLIFRDTKSGQETKIGAYLSELNSKYSPLKTTFLPNITDMKKAGVKSKVDLLRKSIFDDIQDLTVVEKRVIESTLKSMLQDDEREFMNESEKFLNDIRSTLIDGNKNHYPLYSLFEEMSQKKLEVAKKDPYKIEFHNGDIFKLHCQVYELECQFLAKRKKDPASCGHGFKKFFSLLQDEKSRLRFLSILSMELQKKQELLRITKKDSKFYEKLSIEIHWRNALINYENINENEKTVLVQAYRDYILDGNPFEIIDGDNFEMQTHILENVFECLRDKKIFVLTVVGPENSGKSTLLNFLFGTSFEARDERCTRGMYGTLVDVSRVQHNQKILSLGYDYILVIDTEGILSCQKNDDEYSQRLLLFSLAVSHVVIINTNQGADESLKNMFVLCAESLKYLEVARVKEPTVYVVFNKRNTGNVNYCQELKSTIVDKLSEYQLKNVINLDDGLHELTEFYIKEQRYIAGKQCTSRSIDEEFINRIQKLGSQIITQSSTIIKNNDDHFCIPSQWMKYAGEVFVTIKKHPKIVKFKEAFERQEYDRFYRKTNELLKSKLSMEQEQKWINEFKSSSIDDIKKNFKILRQAVGETLKKNIEKDQTNYKLTNETYKKLLDLFDSILNNRFASLERRTILAAEGDSHSRIFEETEQKFQSALIQLTFENCPTDEQSATIYIEQSLNQLFPNLDEQLKPDTLWKNAVLITSYLWISFENNNLLAGIDPSESIDFLKSTDTKSTEYPDLKDILNNIHTHCITLTKNGDLITGDFTKENLNLSENAINVPMKYMDSAKLTEYYERVRKEKDFRTIIQRGLRRIFIEYVEQNQKEILKIEECFDSLISEIKSTLSKVGPSKNIDLNEAEKLLKLGSDRIQEFNEELKKFDFKLAEPFCRSIYTYILLSIIAYNYVRLKSELLGLLEKIKEKQKQLVGKFAPMILVKENRDEIYAEQIRSGLSKAIIKTFTTEITEAMDEDLVNHQQTLEKRNIIEDIDAKNINETTDDHSIIDYIIDPYTVINDQFENNWRIIKDGTKLKLNQKKQHYLDTMSEFYESLKTIHEQLNQIGGSTISFVDQSLTYEDGNTDEKSELLDKRVGMGKLLYSYLTGESTEEKLSINDRIYVVNGVWSNFVAEHPPSDTLKSLISSAKDNWNGVSISFIGRFLNRLVTSKDTLCQEIDEQMSTLIDSLLLMTHDKCQKQLQRCRERCPCCKRVCDFIHHTDIPIGQGENKHRCELGHQLRGMGGVYYETTNEASLMRCEALDDNDIIKIERKRKMWKTFKAECDTWILPSKNNNNIDKDFHRNIWLRIGRKLCDNYNAKYNYQMRYVIQNLPLPVNHFIFILDHSGSMNEAACKFSETEKSDPNEPEITHWTLLLRALETFISIRKQLLSLNDQITAIIFGNRAQCVLKRVSLDLVETSHLNLPMEICGGGTNYDAPLQEAANVLKELQNDSIAERIQNTIIFLTDGDPQIFSMKSAEQVANYRKGSRSDVTIKSFIHRFWTMSFGKFERKYLELINKTMDGNFVDIESSTHFDDKYSQIAEVCPIE